MSGKPFLTPNEAAAVLMVTTATLRTWTEKGLLNAQTTAGGHRRFSRKELERFQAERGQVTGALRILVVDDEPPISRYLSDLLSGFENVVTATAQDGFSAGQLVQTFRPHFLLLDLMMPGLDGFQVCQRIKSESGNRDIRVIAMTGYPSPDNIERILAAGAESCLSKPLDEAQLLDAIGIPDRIAMAKRRSPS